MFSSVAGIELIQVVYGIRDTLQPDTQVILSVQDMDITSYPLLSLIWVW